MSKREIMCTRFGEMVDMIACYAIFNGAKAKKKMTFEEMLEVE